MKKTIILLATAAVAIILSAFCSSCRRTSHNGEIDGFWRIVKIEYLANDGQPAETVTPEDYFISINLELLQLCRRTEFIPSRVSYQATGIMSYDKKGDKLGVEFPMSTDEKGVKLLADFGILHNPVMFDIEKLSCKDLILRSPESRIYCRRF